MPLDYANPEPPAIRFDLQIDGANQGSIRTVSVGLSKLPTIIITATEDSESTHGMVISLITGGPITPDEDGLNELVDWLEIVTETIKSDEFRDNFEAKVSETDE